MSRLKGLVFPLALSLILGGLSAWLGRISEVEIQETKLPPDEPQYLMTQLEGARFDLSGSLKEKLTADKAWQLPEQQTVHFQSPDLQMLSKGQELYRVNAQTARYDLDNKTIRFEENVRLNKAADAARPAASMTTTYLIIDVQSETVSTDAPVAFNYGLSQGTANGIRYDHKNGQLNLPSRVKALIYEPK